jgi:RNA polymerase sigma-70 factor (ECF subfamily)
MLASVFIAILPCKDRTRIRKHMYRKHLYAQQYPHKPRNSAFPSGPEIPRTPLTPPYQQVTLPPRQPNRASQTAFPSRTTIRKPCARVSIRSSIYLVTAEKRAELKATDASLIHRIVQRDESALAALYDRYAGMLSSVLNRILRDTQAAEEILQDIFYQLWRNAAQFDSSRGSLSGWLLVIARNRALSRLRRHNPASGDELSENTVVVASNLESSVAQQQLMSKVISALDNLPKEQRAAIELAYFEGLTHSEIAQRTGDPLGTVKTRLRSAVETLKRDLHS